jgi:hypothetical protein
MREARDFLTRQIAVEGAEKIAEGKTGGKESAGGATPAAPTSDILSRTAISSWSNRTGHGEARFIGPRHRLSLDRPVGGFRNEAVL